MCGDVLKNRKERGTSLLFVLYFCICLLAYLTFPFHFLFSLRSFVNDPVLLAFMEITQLEGDISLLVLAPGASPSPCPSSPPSTIARARLVPTTGLGGAAPGLFIVLPTVPTTALTHPLKKAITCLPRCFQPAIPAFGNRPRALRGCSRYFTPRSSGAQFFTRAKIGRSLRMASSSQLQDTISIELILMFFVHKFWAGLVRGMDSWQNTWQNG